MTLVFGEMIKQYRKENKLTQEQFSKLINKTQVTVSDYEKGTHFPKGAEEIKLIANIIGVPADFVIDAIIYSRNCFVEPSKIVIELDKIGLQNGFKLALNGEELTEDELKTLIEIMRYNRFKREQELKGE